MDVAKRTARLLALIPWVATQKNVSLDELASRFDYPKHQLQADIRALTLEDTLNDFGNTFSDLVSIDWSPSDDRLSISCPSWLSDPLRLNGDEAARLLVAGQAALSIADEASIESGTQGYVTTETPPLLRALTKLQLMLDDSKRGLNTRYKYAEQAGNLNDKGKYKKASVDSKININLKTVPESMLKDLRRAMAERKRVEVEYYSYGRDELTARIVDPFSVFNREGAWYFSGWCHTASAERLLRVDRIRSLEVLNTAATTNCRTENTATKSTVTFDSEACDRTVTLCLDKQSKWAADCFPVLERRKLDDHKLEIDVAVSELSWLVRLLLQLGQHVEVVSDDPDVLEMRSSIADRILKRYQ